MRKHRKRMHLKRKKVYTQSHLLYVLILLLIVTTAWVGHRQKSVLGLSVVSSDGTTFFLGG